ncbi:tetratricopeptide (TPR) repeat protein [Paucibacter oligotrophus]|uniref:Tetratricopeptide (TPR) repeat protein n=1 Tax=Roseateles oligotrophus TaxID=1769250 RepID=A0A840L1F7_9BURK|nr:tetratricopeptide repeat protein [Roseateles oligotrophus]MBB4841661.1 tetratricopeptide (TPR) repeat protein [Roseateles oligotrophus]
MSAQAQLFKDAQWQAWADSGKLAELERAATARQAAQADDEQAAVALALVAMDNGETKRLEAALQPVQACVERKPDSAACAYALGSLQGMQAMRGGMMTAIRLSGSIKTQLQRAVELDPLLFEAREALLQFYLMAPGVAGGSVSKARELAAAAQARQPEHAKLLRASIAGQEDKPAETERELASVRPGADLGLQSALREAWFALGSQYFSLKQLPNAKRVFEQMQRDYPGWAAGFYGAGRVLTEMGQADEAIQNLELARKLDGADKLPVDHRLGLALLAKGDKPQARLALQRFVSSAKHPNPRNLEDAKKKLAELG